MSVYGNKTVTELVDNFKNIEKSFEGKNICNFVNESLIAINENTRSLINTIESQYERLYHHLIKFKVQPERQGSSWINSITDAIYQINKIKNVSQTAWNSIDYNILKSSYQKGLKEVEELLERKISENVLEKEFFDKDIVINKNFIKRWLINNCRDNKVIDLINNNRRL